MDASGSNPGQSVIKPATAAGRIALLAAHFARHLDRYTPDALRAAALGDGYTAEEVDQAMTQAQARLETARLAGPIRARARLMVVLAYLLTYGALAIVLLATPVNSGGMGAILLAVLTVALGGVLLGSLMWVNRHTGTLVAMLVVPYMLLVALSGLCLASVASTAFPAGA